MATETLLDGTRNSQTIRCLACGTPRVASGKSLGAAGACGRCGYVGWAYACDFDPTTRRMLTARRRVTPPLHAPVPDRARVSVRLTATVCSAGPR